MDGKYLHFSWSRLIVRSGRQWSDPSRSTRREDTCRPPAAAAALDDRAPAPAFPLSLCRLSLWLAGPRARVPLTGRLAAPASALLPRRPVLPGASCCARSPCCRRRLGRAAGRPTAIGHCPAPPRAPVRRESFRSSSRRRISREGWARARGARWLPGPRSLGAGRRCLGAADGLSWHCGGAGLPLPCLLASLCVRVRVLLLLLLLLLLHFSFFLFLFCATNLCTQARSSIHPAFICLQQPRLPFPSLCTPALSRTRLRPFCSLDTSWRPLDPGGHLHFKRA